MSPRKIVHFHYVQHAHGLASVPPDKTRVEVALHDGAESHYLQNPYTSVFVSADISVRSPRKIVYFQNVQNVYEMNRKYPVEKSIQS